MNCCVVGKDMLCYASFFMSMGNIMFIRFGFMFAIRLSLCSFLTACGDTESDDPMPSPTPPAAQGQLKVALEVQNNGASPVKWNFSGLAGLDEFLDKKIQKYLGLL